MALSKEGYMKRIEVLLFAIMFSIGLGCGTPAENARIEADEDMEESAGDDLAEVGDDPGEMDFDDPAQYPEAEMEAVQYPE